MIGRLGSRIFELIILVFALYAFVFVPLGKRTGLEHVKAILGTDEAKAAGEELSEAGDRLKRQMLGGQDITPIRGEPVLPELPKGTPVQMRVVPAEHGAHDALDAGVDASLVD